MSIETATDIYARVVNLYSESLEAQNDTVPGSNQDHRTLGRTEALAQVLQLIEDEFGVLPYAKEVRA